MSRRLRLLERAQERGLPVDMSPSYVVVDEKRIWGIDLDEQTAIRCREVIAGSLWSRTVMVRRLSEIPDEDAVEARGHFESIGIRVAREPGQAWEKPIRWAKRVGQRRLVVNLLSHQNGVGLTQDVALLDRMLKGEGHDVEFFEWRDGSRHGADVNFYLELFDPKHFATARSHIGLFNLEWFDRHQTGFLRAMTQCWAKSHEAHAVYESIGDVRSIYTGFLSRDMLRAEALETRSGIRCLHVRGKASQKGTQTVIDAWNKHGADLPPLTITSAEDFDGCGKADRRYIDLRIGYQSEDDLATLMTQCRVHVCPSETEGWGHYIAEAISAHGVVVTVDGSPMNEHVLPTHGVLLPAARIPSGLVTRYQTEPSVLAQGVFALARKAEADLDAMGRLAREHWERRGHFFRERALALLSHV